MAERTYLITGATSGIGAALTRALIARGDRVIGTGRRAHLLDELHGDLGDSFVGLTMDVTDVQRSVEMLGEMFDQYDVGTVILNAGVSQGKETPDWQGEAAIVATNAMAFTAHASFTLRQFMKRGSGHLVGISSVASRIVSAKSSAYCASKTYVSRYLHGLRLRARAAGFSQTLHVTDLRPGYIETPMIENHSGVFWAISAERCAEIMIRLMDRKVRAAYVPRRWRLIAGAVRVIPPAWLQR